MAAEDDFAGGLDFTKQTELFCHEIKLEGLDRIDSLFLKYLKRVKDASTSEYTAKLDKRTLMITPSNSCQLFQPISAKQELKATTDKKTKSSIVLDPTDAM
jgi:hypothetical protein